MRWRQRIPGPLLQMPRLGLAAFRRRMLVHGVFLLLVLGTLSLALAVLQGEKERAWKSYVHGFARSQAEVMARLRHPTGQLALLNAGYGHTNLNTDNDTNANSSATLSPLLLPYAAIDFDDNNKARQAVEMAGCSVLYPDGSSVCAAIGSNPYAGGFIYLVGQFLSPTLVGRPRGQLDLSTLHRAHISLTMRGTTTEWTAPYEALPSPRPDALRGRLTGFAGNKLVLDAQSRPVRDFRGWLWQDGPCLPQPATSTAHPSASLPNNTTAEADTCMRTAFFSVRLPVDAFSDALFTQSSSALVWPPADLANIRLRIQMWGPENAEPTESIDATPPNPVAEPAPPEAAAAQPSAQPPLKPRPASKPLFDTQANPGIHPMASLADISSSLQPGEQVRITKIGSTAAPLLLQAAKTTTRPPPSWLTHLIRWLPLDEPATPPIQTARLGTLSGAYDVQFSGDLRGVEQSLGTAATRMVGYVSAMLAAIALGWLVIAVGFLRKVKTLTRRAAAVSYNIQDGHLHASLDRLEVADLRGTDELGILAGGLADLLQRVKDDLHREQLRAQQERDMWHAVGHEIMSPLQSLMVLHASTDDPARRYVQRMQQAVHVLYGTASPAEAIAAADVPQGRLDLDAFLSHVAANAHFAGIEHVVYQRKPTLGSHAQAIHPANPVIVRADEFSLEDVITHILRNADRYRPKDAPITLTLTASESTASATIYNPGTSIADEVLDKIFELGVSDATWDAPADTSSTTPPPPNAERRGQGLFVAKTYMSKMGGTISAHNTQFEGTQGVAFMLTFQRLG